MSEEYNAVPPPSEASGVNFSDALARAKAIAAKLSADSGKKDLENGSGNKRNHDDDHDQYGYNRGGAYDNEEYRRDYGDYNDSKRQAYDRADNSRARYGSGGEERRSNSSYGPSGGSVSSEFGIPSTMVGLVIGRGGESLKRIERAHGVKVQFAQDQPPSDPERKVTVLGAADDVQQARDTIMQIIEEAKASRANGGGYSSRHSIAPGQSTVYINVPNNKVGLVIGKGGETIRMLQERSGARIAVTPDSARDPSSQERPVSVIGDEAAIERARVLIDEVINGDPYRNRGGQGGYGGQYGGAGGYGQQYGGNFENVTIQVPNDVVGLLIGKGGETIKMLQQQSGAKIQIEQVTGGAPGPERNIFISGTPDSVGYAKQLVYERTSTGNRNSKSSRHGEKSSDEYNQGYSQDPYSAANQSGYNYGYYDYQNYGQTPGYEYYQGQHASATGAQRGDGHEDEENAENSNPASVSQEYPSAPSADATGYDQSQYANYYAQYGQYADAYQQYYAQYYQQQGYAYPPQEGTEASGEIDNGQEASTNEAGEQPTSSEKPAEDDPAHPSKTDEGDAQGSN